MVHRKKRRKRPAGDGGAGHTRPFNPALEALKALKARASRREPPSPPAAARERAAPDDAAVFRQAMSDVRPLDSGKKTVARIPDSDVRPAHPAPDDDLDVLAHLSDLVSGNAEMDVTFSDEYIEGAVPGFSPKLMKRLRGGQFAFQDHLDLHGLTQHEAEVRVREFLLRSHRLGLRCVLVVHGRGLNSENHIPVLKERLPVWLSRGPVRRMVLAFSTARPYDGGTGAVYILIRKAGAGGMPLTALGRGHPGKAGH
jgi:DNA-nicking Smr family endonuclease